MTACSFDNKIWLFFNTPFGSPKAVYNSTDGVLWNLVTDSPNYSNTSGIYYDGSLMTACSFDNKMWLFFNNPGGYPKTVYTSTDGVSWNLVTNSPNYATTSGRSSDGSLMTACSFDNKMWLFFNTPDGNPKGVFTSTDGASWNLLTDSPNYAATSGSYPDGSVMTACSFGGKIWLFFNTPNGDPKSVYISGKTNQ
jgi:Tol biopolymer transport system component